MAQTNNLLVLGTSNLLGAVNVFGTITAASFKGDVTGNVSGSSSYVAAKADYSFDATTLPQQFERGVTAGFVSSSSGFPNYGSVLTVRTYSGGGGTLQLYAPYSASYGGTRLRARFGNYEVSSGNSWTTLKEIAWTDDIPTKLASPYLLTISGGTASNSLGSYDGSGAKTITVTPGNIGALPASPTAIEMNNGGGLKNYGGHIDFHFHDSNGKPHDTTDKVVDTVPDYSSRIIEDLAGRLNVNGSYFSWGGKATMTSVGTGSITASGALTISGTSTLKGAIILSANAYGPSLPSSGSAGQIFFKLL